INYLAIAGVASYTGRPNEGPVPLGIQVADIAGGSMHAITGILAAVIERQDSKLGQFIDISMTDTAFALNAMTGAGALGTGESPGLGEGILNGGSFYDYYQTADGRYFSVGSLEPQFLKLLAETLESPHLMQLGLSQKPEDQQQLRKELSRIFASKNYADWQSIFKSVDACVEPVLTLTEAANHPQLVEREMVVEVETSYGTKIKQIASPIKFSRNPATYKQAGSGLGAQSHQVLKELGYTSEAIKRLEDEGALG
ncbi:CoA transferase, partial [Marinospirillum insulare]